MDIRKDILWRVYLCFLGMVVLCVFVIGRAVYIQRAQGKFWRGMGDSLHIKSEPIIAERGSIYSEDGNMLSTSVPVFNVYIDFGADGLREKNGKRFRDNIDSLSICLATLFSDTTKDGHKTATDYKRELQAEYNDTTRYYVLKKKVNFDKYLQLRDFPLVRMGKNKSGFIIEAEDKRINPYGLLANRTIGLSRSNDAGNVGLELTYDSLLKGLSGQRFMRYAAGAYMPVEGSELDPVRGKDIVTTLDTYMQDVAENALMNMLVKNNSTHGTVIVMETATGKIKAIANLGQQFKKDSSVFYTEDLNYGIGRVTEPGSVFKLATLLSLLEDGYVDISSTVNCNNGSQNFYGLTVHDSHAGVYNTTVKEAFAASSNVAFATLANTFYHEQPQKFLDHLHRLRLDMPSGIDIIASSGSPRIKKVGSKFWSATSIPWMAHGYEVEESPLSMLMLYNAVANNGTMMRPYLVNEIRDYGVTIKKFNPFVLEQKICSDSTIAKLKECMLAVVEEPHGTAHKVVFDSLYKIAGKTGTAVSAFGNTGYRKDSKVYQASFMGYFPADHPKYTMAVVIQNSRRSKLVYGADVSGAVFKEVSDKLYAHFLSAPANNASFTTDSITNTAMGLKNDMRSILGFLHIPYNDAATSGSWRNLALLQNNGTMNPAPSDEYASAILPDMKGMGLKDAVFFLENKGLKIAVQGRGKVISQSLPAGTNINKGQKITLFLN